MAHLMMRLALLLAALLTVTAQQAPKPAPEAAFMKAINGKWEGFCGQRSYLAAGGKGVCLPGGVPLMSYSTQLDMNFKAPKAEGSFNRWNTTMNYMGMDYNLPAAGGGFNVTKFTKSGKGWCVTLQLAPGLVVTQRWELQKQGDLNVFILEGDHVTATTAPDFGGLCPAKGVQKLFCNDKYRVRCYSTRR